MLEKTLESPLDSKEIKPVNHKGNQPWIGLDWCWRTDAEDEVIKRTVIRRTDAEAEALILCPPDVKSWLIGKDPDARKDWGQEERLRWLDGIIDSMDMSLSKL